MARMLFAMVQGAVIGALLVGGSWLWYWLQLRGARGLPIALLDAVGDRGGLSLRQLREAVGRGKLLGQVQVALALSLLEFRKRVRRVYPPGTPYLERYASARYERIGAPPAPDQNAH